MSGDTQRTGDRYTDDEPLSLAGTADADRTPGDGTPEQEPRPRRSRARRLLIAISALGLVLALLVGGGFWYLTNRYGGNIDRVGDVFAGLEEGSRPAPATPAESSDQAPVTLLLMGSDTRATAEEGIAAGGRADAIMIARFAGDRQQAQVISIPRDSWVDIPGHGKNKINAAYAYGGPTLLIQTVEQLTGIRIDHYAAIDFEGLIELTDDLGGVDVTVAETTSNGPYTFTAGVNHLDGDEARWYLGQRYGLPGGDFDRVRRQQQYLQAVFGQLFSSNTFSDPARLDAALRTVTDSVAVDDGLSNTALLSLGYSLRGVTPGSVDFFTAPVLGTGTEGTSSVVYLNAVAGDRMWGYLRTDSLGANAEEFSKQSLPDTPR